MGNTHDGDRWNKAVLEFLEKHPTFTRNLPVIVVLIGGALLWYALHY